MQFQLYFIDSDMSFIKYKNIQGDLLLLYFVCMYVLQSANSFLTILFSKYSIYFSFENSFQPLNWEAAHTLYAIKTI